MNLQGHLNPLARERLTLRLRVPSDPSWHASLDCPCPLQHVEPGARSSGVDWIHAFALSFPWHQMCNHCITCLPDFDWLNVARRRPRAFLPHCDKKAFFFLSEPVAFRRVYGLESYQRGIEPPQAVCQRHKSAAIPTALRGRLIVIKRRCSPIDLHFACLNL